MANRSLTTTLALAFGSTTLAVFVLVGSYVYFAFDRQIKAQDDSEIVLAARHVRRLAEELDSASGVREHADRLTSVVLGNQTLSMAITGSKGQALVAHNFGQSDAVAGPPPPRWALCVPV